MKKVGHFDPFVKKQVKEQNLFSFTCFSVSVKSLALSSQHVYETLQKTRKSQYFLEEDLTLTFFSHYTRCLPAKDLTKNNLK